MVQFLKFEYMHRKFCFTEHALDEIDNDDLNIEDVMNAAVKGEVIEDYPKDKPYPSCLMLGWFGLGNRQPLHVVCAKDNNDYIHVITAYKPNADKWANNFTTRKKNKK
jgi:hypothetical protein